MLCLNHRTDATRSNLQIFLHTSFGNVRDEQRRSLPIKVHGSFSPTFQKPVDLRNGILGLPQAVVRDNSSIDSSLRPEISSHNKSSAPVRCGPLSRSFRLNLDRRSTRSGMIWTGVMKERH